MSSGEEVSISSTSNIDKGKKMAKNIVVVQRDQFGIILQKKNRLQKENMRQHVIYVVQVGIVVNQMN